MKDTIKTRLQQGYKNLGLADDVFERVASVAQTFIADEAKVDEFVKTAEPLLRMYQSAADKVRGELSAKIKGLEGEKADLEAKLNGANNTNVQQAAEKPAQKSTEDVSEIIRKAVAEAVAPLQQKLTEFEGAQSQKAAVKSALAKIDAWDYAKAYPKERKKAQEAALELYEAYGKKWTAEELEQKIREKFTAEVAEKGIDTAKPYESDGGADEKVDISEQLKLLKNQGVEL